MHAKADVRRRRPSRQACSFKMLWAQAGSPTCASNIANVSNALTRRLQRFCISTSDPKAPLQGYEAESASCGHDTTWPAPPACSSAHFLSNPLNQASDSAESSLRFERWRACNSACSEERGVASLAKIAAVLRRGDGNRAAGEFFNIDEVMCLA